MLPTWLSWASRRGAGKGEDLIGILNSVVKRKMLDRLKKIALLMFYEYKSLLDLS